MTVSPRTRWISVIAAAAALVAGALAFASVSATQAAWTDRAYASASVSAGTWATASGCTAMDSSGKAVGTCTISSMTYQGWGTPGNHTRNVYLTFQVSSSSTSYIVFTADLSKATGSDSGTGTWNWPTAATLTSSQITPTSACSALPTLSGRTVAGWSWAPSNTVYFQLTDNKSGNAGSVSCS